MSDFVEQCRREWRRLGVPDQQAEEMAQDLASDLREAEAEGVSVEELLGRSASDPRAFAATWAAERGLVPAPDARAGARRGPRVLVAFTALAAITAVVAALLLATGEPKAALVARSTGPRRPPAGGSFVPPGAHRLVVGNLAAPVEWILLVLALAALGCAAWLWSSWRRSRPPGAPA